MSIRYTQTHRFLQITTPFADQALLLDALEGVETVSEPFHFKLSLRSERRDIALKTGIGSPVGVCLRTAHPEPRHFHGYLGSFAHTGGDGGFAFYEATLVPWTHFLTLNCNCRVFQNLTTLDIVKQVFAGHGALADYDIRVSRKYQLRTLCIQYNESDYAFISRLLASEGIYHYFRFEKDRHTLILTDDSTRARPMPGQSLIAFNREFGMAKADNVHGLTSRRRATASHYAIRSFDYKAPRVPSLTKRNQPNAPAALAHLEHYEHLGAYAYPAYPANEAFASLRTEALACQGKVFEGAGNVRTLTCGHCFELKGHDRLGSGDDARFFALSVHHVARNNYDAESESTYENHFTALPSKVPFRPERKEPPAMRGPQTALVVGPSSEEIFCDEHGRIKVQFHWDREGKEDGESSCWVRVATSWAGDRFGFISLPRVGTEVVVDFLEGHPDRPLVTGAVYNGWNRPPWELPAHKTQSGIATRSTKSGNLEHANILRFEDLKGQEEIWLHAEKDQRIEVEHDESHSVGHDRTKHVEHDETTTIGHDRTETVAHDERIHIHGHQTVNIDQTRTETILLADTQWVGLGRTETIGGAYALSVGLAKNELVGLASFEEVGLNKTTLIGRNGKTSATHNYELHAGEVLTLSAGKQIRLAVGKATFLLHEDGTINQAGTNLVHTASSAFHLIGNDVEVNPNEGKSKGGPTDDDEEVEGDPTTPGMTAKEKRRERREFLDTKLKEMGITDANRRKQIISGYDLNKPVSVVKAKPGDRLAQYQPPGGDTGQWVARGDPPPHPDSLGISPAGTCKDGMTRTKVCNMHTPKDEIQLLKGTARKTTDTWSVKRLGPDGKPLWKEAGTPVQTHGGATQYFLPDPSRLSTIS